jgi:hypothetical protein
MPRLNLRETAARAQLDPKQALLDSIGDRIDGWEIGPCRVLVATYVAPEITKGGIIRPDRSMTEDRFQSPVGLIVKLGPLCFEDDSIAKFGGFCPKLHDWVQFNPSSGRELFAVGINDVGTSCRLFRDQQIDMKIPDPSMVW